MAGFLEEYGVSDVKREKGLKRIIFGAIGLVVVVGAAYFIAHDWREKRQVSTFFDLLQQKQYEAAYRLWGCDAAHPCRDYSMDRFLEDWGPKSAHANVSSYSVRRTRSCDSGVIQIVQFKPGDEVLLYIDRANRNLSFSPFEYCVDPTGKNTKFLDIFFR